MKKTEKTEKTKPPEKRKRRGWLEKHLALGSETDLKQTEKISTEESEKVETSKNEALKEEPTAKEPLKQEVAQETDDSGALAQTTKSAALTFTKEETTIAVVEPDHEYDLKRRR